MNQLHAYLIALAAEGDQAIFVPLADEALADALNNDLLLAKLAQLAALAATGNTSNFVVTLPPAQATPARALLTAIAETYKGEALGRAASTFAAALVN
jgi:hypothetical protein